MLEDEVFNVASRFLRKIRRGANSEISAICPFHRKADGSEEKHPSFTMNLSKGVYYCHTCHERGNMRTFLKNMGVGLTVLHNQYAPLLEALQKNHVAPTFNPTQARHIVTETPLPEAILGLFEKCPLPMVDPDYRLNEDDPVYDEALLQKYDIGFDEIHGRITFPLRDLAGNLMGISGRACDPSVRPRYKVYDTEYTAFDMPARAQTKKSSILWNAHNVYPHVYRGSSKERVVLVEGFKACLWLLQAGIPNVVALAGSSLSEYHIWILERMGAQVLLMFDNDLAGQSGLLKTAPQLARSLDVFIVNYEGRQPTNLTQEEVRQSVEKNCEDYYLWVTRQKKERNHGIR